MKQLFKKAVLCLTLVVSVLMLAACQNGKSAKVESLEPDMKQMLEEYMGQFVEAQYYSKSSEEIEALIAQAEKNKDAITFNGLTNYLNSQGRLGDYQSIDSVAAEKTEEGYRVVVDATFTKRVLKLTLGFDEEFKGINEMTFEPVYTLGEQMSDAAGNLVIGMGTVFAVLIFIAWVISLFKYIKVFEDLLKNKKKAAAPASAPKAAPAPAPAPAPVSAPAGISDNELQAVIAAAIAAYEADMGAQDQGFVPGPSLNNGLVVRSIRRH